MKRPVSKPRRPSRHLLDGLLGMALALVTLALYWPSGRFEFLDYDDPVYVVENPHVAGGLSHEGIVWAFARLTGDGTYWHPMTWLSHMLDCQLFGVNAGPQHLVNVGFHIANTLLLFVVLRRMTQATWRSALVAAVFAWHPWQVESVAWVAERKNVVSTFFWMLTLWAYVRYAQSAKAEVRRPKEGRSPNAKGSAQDAAHHAPHTAHRASRFTFHASPFYLLSLLFFALGLMSKPMLVTVPFVLLLLDYWPLGRLGSLGSGGQSLKSQVSSLKPTVHGARKSYIVNRIWAEKLPFLAMSGAVIWITMAGHHRFNLAATWSPVPLAARLANGLVSYAAYIAGTFWPSHLAVLYPFPDHWPVALAAGAGLLLAGVSAWALWQVRQRPYLAVGWFWFLGTLVPVIGVVQDGVQAMADRYMYVPLVGLLLALCWGAAELAQRLGRAGWAAPLAILAILACIGTTRYQLQFWKNSLALFARTAAVTRNNYIIEEDLGVALAKTGALAEARSHFDEALRIKPEHPNAHFNLGLWLMLKGQSAEAAVQYREALRLRPNYAKAMNNLAWLLATHCDPHATNDVQEAIRLARGAANLTEGNDPGTLDTLAAAYAAAHEFAGARTVAERAVTLARNRGQNEMARQIEARLAGYRSEQPYREP